MSKRKCPFCGSKLADDTPVFMTPLEVMDFKEKITRISHNAINYGEGYEHCLGLALMNADYKNRLRIIKAFPEFCDTFLNWDKNEKD